MTGLPLVENTNRPAIFDNELLKIAVNTNAQT